MAEVETFTYAGSKLRATLEVPTDTSDGALFAALGWIGGGCTLRSVPKITRDWVAVPSDEVCEETNKDTKGSSKWQDVTFPVTQRPDDALLAVIRELERSRVLIGSFELVMPGRAGTVYWTAQVAMFDLVGGGGKDEKHYGDVKMFIQTTPVVVIPPAA